MKRLTPEIVRKMHLGRSPQAVMILILQKARSGDSCYLGQSDIAQALSVHWRTAMRALESLEGLGLITRERRHDRRGFRTTDQIFVHHDAWSIVPNGRQPTGQNVRLAKVPECQVGLPDKMSGPIYKLHTIGDASADLGGRDGDVASNATDLQAPVSERTSLFLIPGGRAA